MKNRMLVMLGAAVVSATACAADEIVCEGEYDGHLQGVATDGTSIYWSHTKTVVKTDLTGKILRKVRAPRHQGDLCYHDGTVYVAVNLGRFNTHENGDSWVFAYDAETLKEMKRWKLQEMVHGAGGMTWANGRFFVIGGLPLDIERNFVYEYAPDFTFVKRHELDTGFTHMGIQTAAFEDGRFLFGIYGDIGDPVGTLECPPALDSFVRRTGPGNVGIIKLNGEYWTGRALGGTDKTSFRGKLVRSPGFPACEKAYAPAKTNRGEIRFFYEGCDTAGWTDAGYRFDPNGNAPLFAPKKRRLYATAEMVAAGEDLPAVGLGCNAQVNDLVRGVRRVAETGDILAFHVPGTPETLKGDPESEAQVKAVLDEAARLGVEVRQNSGEPVRAEKTFLATFDGSRQSYIEIEPVPFRPESGALIALHGHGSDRHQFADDRRGECAAAREAALRRGLLYVSPDYRAKTSWMGPAAEADVLDLLETLRRERGVAKFFFCGGSMGGTSALTFAARHPDLVAGVVALNPLADHLSYGKFQDAIAASFGGDKDAAHDEYFSRSAINYPERFTMPVSITVGGADKTVPPESARELARKISFCRPDLIHFDEVAERRHETDYAASKKAFDEMFARADKAVARFRDNTIRLAAVNSSAPDRAAADFLCTGEHDERVFNRAVRLLPFGGRIVLSDGDYYFDACDQEGGSAVFLDYNEGRARVITFAGVTDSKAYNTRYGAGIHVTEKAMRAMSTNGVYRVFFGSPKRPPRGDFGPYPGDFYTYTHVNNLRLENMQILFANAAKPLRGVDGSNFGSLYMRKVYIYQESYFRDRFMHIGRPDIPIAGTVGVWSVPGSNDEAAEIRYDHVQVGGLHTGFVFDGVDHLIMEVSGACRCVQGYDFHSGAKTLTIINCADEGNTYLPRFRGKGGHVTMIDFNIERFNEKFIPVDPEHARTEHGATEDNPGTWHGDISYTLQGGCFGFKRGANPFWAPGHGGGMRTMDQNAP